MKSSTALLWRRTTRSSGGEGLKSLNIRVGEQKIPLDEEEYAAFPWRYNTQL